MGTGAPSTYPTIDHLPEYTGSGAPKPTLNRVERTCFQIWDFATKHPIKLREVDDRNEAERILGMLSQT